MRDGTNPPGRLCPHEKYEPAVEDFPVVVVNDMHGEDLYTVAKEKYRTYRND